jgi:radical SAM superfamily enzyme YgiQ (UPF0313 family)
MEMLGIMSISSFVKERGHETGVFIPGSEDEFLALLEQERPEVVGFSCSTGLEDKLLKFARIAHRMRSPRPLVIFGGPHPTFYPDVIEDRDVDIICRGQGEIPMAEILGRIDRDEPIEGIENLWIKKRGKIEKNPQGKLVTDLDQFPFPDRDLYQSYPVISNNPTKHFITLRECPFECTFCFNHAWKGMHPNRPVYKNRHPEKVIEEIKAVQATYPTKIILFWDGTFNLNKRWLTSFLEGYRKEVRLPFRCSLRADLVDEETIRLLKEGNCSWVKLGVETGNQVYRNEVMKKRLKDEAFLKTSALLHKYRIPFSTSNLLGLPGENLEMALETLRLNIDLRPSYTFAYTFLPYPGTKLGQFALEEGYIEAPKIHYEYADSFTGVSLNLKDKDRIENLQKFFALLTQVPVLLPLARQLIKLPPNRAFRVVEKISRLLFFWCRSANFPGLIPLVKEFLFGFGFQRQKTYNRALKNTAD